MYLNISVKVQDKNFANQTSSEKHIARSLIELKKVQDQQFMLGYILISQILFGLLGSLHELIRKQTTKILSGNQALWHLFSCQKNFSLPVKQGHCL